MSARFDAETLRKLMVSPRWTGQVRLDATPELVARWDPSLLRASRVLTPIDVQALYVPEGDASKYVRLPFGMTAPDGQPPEQMPKPFEDGVTRAPGVHLHWAMPDSLLRGKLQQVADGSQNRLGMPALPDRWVVLRIIAPKNASTVAARGWVLEADTAKAIPLEQWPTASASTPATGRTIAKDQLTATVGGSVNWSAVYDAVQNRFAFHDPLDDLQTAAPNGAVNDLAAYVVAGWWSDPKLDPLDGVDTSASLSVRLSELGWFLVTDAEGGYLLNRDRTLQRLRRESLGLMTAERYGNLLSNATFTVASANLDSEAKIKQAVSPATAFMPQTARLVTEAASVVASEPRWPRSTLLHGSVHGVPVHGLVVVDQRPAGADVDVAFGRHDDDLAAAFAANGLSTEDRRGMERLLSAFTGQVLSKLGTADGLALAEEHEHNAGFGSRPGGEGLVERLRKGAEAGPFSVGRAGRSEQARLRSAKRGAKLTWMGGKRADLYIGTVADQREQAGVWAGEPPVTELKTEVREVRRPAPRYYQPLDPMIAVRGAKRNLRHNGDGRFSPNQKLQCRWPSQVPTKAQGVLDGADYIVSLPTGGIPDEVLILARNAVVQDPYWAPWLAAIEAARRNFNPGILQTRLAAEAAVRYGRNGVYDGGTTAFQSSAIRADRTQSVISRSQVADELRRFSIFAGVDVDPVGVTAWSQPWAPLWLEWDVELLASDRLEGWTLEQIDFALPENNAANSAKSFQGRSLLHAGTARTLAAAIEEWLKVEEQRDRNNQGEVDGPTAESLHKIADAIGQLDVLSTSLDELNSRLLGLPVGDFGVLRERNPDGSLKSAAPIAVPQLLVSGELRLVRARIVDAFGRTLDLPLDRVRVVTRDQGAGAQAAIALRPRIQRPARWMFRLVDPSLSDVTPGAQGDSAGAAEATIDQIDPSQQINPVAGFLLPDHIDEALESFDTAGQPLGQLMHEPFGGGVVWEIAPGRSGPADAGPGFNLPPQQRLLGLLAAGMVAADAKARGGKAANPDEESALSAFLRAIDTTLWTVDTFANLGNEHIAGLVGRPIAVVRATLRLEIADDLAELDLSAEGERARREAAYRDLADRAFPVRLGELTRSDDGLLGFFVDDDYSQFHVVDKVVRDAAFDVRRGRGQFDQLGSAKQLPDVKPIIHPYIVAEDELLARPGQTLRLTLLMHPAGRVHLTSGILPRKSLQLARDWAHPGLAVIAPSMRVGPVLVDPDQIRLPKVSSFPKDQIWTRRNTPSTWKDDPILAATQTALFPELPAEIQEGYIRVAPKSEPGGNS